MVSNWGFKSRNGNQGLGVAAIPLRANVVTTERVICNLLNSFSHCELMGNVEYCLNGRRRVDLPVIQRPGKEASRTLIQRQKRRYHASSCKTHSPAAGWRIRTVV